jgi:hypothetical protein
VIALGVVAVALDQLGVGGYRYGSVILTFAMPIAVGAITWLLTRHIGPTAIIAVLALLLAGTVATRAPWSTGRLESALDDLRSLQGFEVLETDHAGHSWCRPRCPAVTRTWHARQADPEAAVLMMAISLADAGLAPPSEQIPRESLASQLVITGSKADAIITADGDDDGTLVTVTLSSHR